MEDDVRTGDDEVQAGVAPRQGLTLVQFSAQRKRFLWGRGCTLELFRGCHGASGGV